METKNFKALCQYCLRPCLDIWMLRGHIQKHHAQVIEAIGQNYGAQNSDTSVSRMEERVGPDINWLSEELEKDES